MALAKRRKATLLVAKLDRLSRSVAFIATLMDNRGFDLAIADMPGANELTLHVLAAAAEHERHMIGERTRQGTRYQAWQSKAGHDQSGEGGRTGSSLAPHIERCIAAGRTSSSAIATDLNARGIAAANGGEWFRMQVRRVRDRLGL
jgi:DNA invertase Pin-like site-specific DNA recombinase